MNWKSVVVSLLVAVTWGAASVAQPTIDVRCVGPTVRIRPTGDIDGGSAAELYCARNETESFQVVVTARDGNLARVTASMSPLRAGDGAEIPADAVTFFREVFVPVRYSAPRATCAPGLIPDPLVPFVNPYTGEAISHPTTQTRQEGLRFGGAGFDVWQDQHQPLWIDIAVPSDAAPGDYAATLTIGADGAKAVEVPVSLHVWNFVLPDGPTHENHFGGFSRVADYLGLKRDSEEFLPIEDRYSAMLAAHRLNPPLPHSMLPPPGEDGVVVVSDDLDARITAFVDAYHLTNIDVPRAPFGDILGANRDKAKRFYQSWYAYLEKKGWAKGAYLYMLDEPNDPEAYEKVRQLGALAAEAEPRLRRLVVEQPYTQNPEWGTLDGSIDIWCPLFGFVHEPSVQRVQAQGDEVWSYTALVQCAPGYHPEHESVRNDQPPFWELDFPVTSYRVSTWLNRRYGITGLLYWSAVYWGSPARNPWDDPGFRNRWNSDGSLFYPGRDAGIDGPVASIRLKSLRDGMEDYEYFEILTAMGGRSQVEEAVREAVPTWGSWNQDPAVLPRLRTQLGEAIEQRVYRARKLGLAFGE
ncbi:MAG: DUF4091 domain-containing protein [bacterium]|nr:DUF4091 domain-containing protein [bacterium]